MPTPTNPTAASSPPPARLSYGISAVSLDDEPSSPSKLVDNVRLDRSRTMFGRAQDATVLLEHASISRQHAEITLEVRGP